MSDTDFPYEIQELEPKLTAEILEYLKTEKEGFVQLGPKKYFLPLLYTQGLHKQIYNMPLKTNDVFVASYPRSGTTWTQELVWMIANDLDYDKSAAIPLTERYPFLEFTMFMHKEIYQNILELNKGDEKKLQMVKEMTTPGPDILAKMPSRRFIKTHLPMSLLPPNTLDVAKVVYVARDPRDSAVSSYHLNRLQELQSYDDFKIFWKYFIKGLYHWTPFFEHLKEAWDKRDHPNMLFLFYEDLSKDLKGSIDRVSKFFNKQYTNEEVLLLCDHLSIESFRNNKSVNNELMANLGLLISGKSFIRKGKSGGWRDYFDEEMTQEAEQWIRDNLRDTDMRFPHMQI